MQWCGKRVRCGSREEGLAGKKGLPRKPEDLSSHPGTPQLEAVCLQSQHAYSRMGRRTHSRSSQPAGLEHIVQWQRTTVGIEDGYTRETERCINRH